MEQNAAAVNGLQMHYSVAGCGPDLLLVHGWASSRRMWAHLAGRLARHFRCWMVDLPGFGDSDKPHCGWYSIPNFTATLAAFIRARGLDRVRVVGHSMGGMISLNLAARYPEVVERLVAINPVVTGRANLRPFARPEYSRRVLGWLVRLSPVVSRPLGHPLGQQMQGLRSIYRRTEDFARCSADSLLESGRAVVAYDVSPLLARIAAPTLVIVGDKDLNVPASEGRLAARGIPNARLHVMRAGHLATDDRPAEVADHLQRFLV